MFTFTKRKRVMQQQFMSIILVPWEPDIGKIFVGG
jgi:hypothetical protein